jgi:hypothetical protein
METQVLTFEKGLFRDNADRTQQPGNYRDALNAVLETEKGDYTGITNERGNAVCARIKEGYKVIGKILTDSDEIVLFSTNNVNSEIGIYNPTHCSYEELINDDCLNFKDYWPIKGVFKVRKGCERIIYFTDRNNTIKVINIDKLSQYYEDDELQCDRLNLTLPVTYASVQTFVRNTGGSLPVGAYSFSYRFLDQNLNPTN